MRRSMRAAIAAMTLAWAAAGCSSAVQGAAAAPAPAPEWHALLGTGSMDQWRGYRDEADTAWHVANGVLTKSGPASDIITRMPYRNFELDFDWKISTGGNSGVFYRATEEYDHVYWSGPEFQLLDDANAPDGQSRLTAAGSDYAVYPSPAGFVKPADQWNTARIVVNGNHVEHWLNGHEMVSYDLRSTDWTARVVGSKFAAWPDYGLAPAGYIGIQGDHPGTLSLRNMRIRELP